MKSLSSGVRKPAYGSGAAARKAVAVLLALLLTAAAAAAQVQERITIAALGDSLTQGYGLPPEDGFVPQLQAWLNANGHPEVEVINAGVSGDTTAGGLSRIGWTLSDEVDAVIVALGGNDVLRGLDPAASRANLDGILSAIGERGVPALVAGMQAPGNYGPDYKREFDAMFPELAEAHGAILYPFFLQGLTGEDGGSLAQVRELMQGDGIHPNAQGVAQIVRDIGPYVARLVDRAQS
ncbi:arylesterase [Rhodobacteraceae bacterium 2CG4]|uniref:Arylesterase n=1 Tax=Halovulum marinum TaxID=2662447 RepID=A0A6L5YZN3_9RHOB|nr:arylesterase [Halovulum marinum]MSU89698.1 arylesterase [Halovulum marinum]